MYEDASLVRDGELLYAGMYLAGSVIGGFAALLLGYGLPQNHGHDGT